MLPPEGFDMKPAELLQCDYALFRSASSDPRRTDDYLGEEARLEERLYDLLNKAGPEFANIARAHSLLKEAWIEVGCPDIDFEDYGGQVSGIVSCIPAAIDKVLWRVVCEALRSLVYLEQTEVHE